MNTETIKAIIKKQNGGNEIKAGDMLRYMNNLRKGITKKPVSERKIISNKIKILI